MKLPSTSKSKARSEAGTALLIAIFALMLISVVGIALVVSAGTDSALAGNYRTATGAYYIGRAGLEEARGRLLYKNPDYLNKSGTYNDLFASPSTNSGAGTTFQLYDVLYVINPANGENVDPTDPSNPYYDSEYATEFGSENVHAPPVTSVSSTMVSGYPGPTFKWVRVNAVTEKALGGLNVDGHSGSDSTTLLYYNGSGLNLTSTGVQALELTSLAVMPDKSTKLLQYVVASNSLQYALVPPPLLSFNQGLPAALTIAGNAVSYAGPDASGFQVNGNDTTTGRTCASPALSSVFAIGYTNSGDQSNVVNGVPTTPTNDTGNYLGATPPSGPPTPSVGQVSLPPTLQKPSQMESLIRTITQSADIVLTPGSPGVAVSGSALTTAAAGFWPTTPMTIVVNGDLDLSSWHNTGYGLLLVTGNLNYDPDASWVGVVLVIGKGTITGSKMGIGQFDGAVMVAQSRDGSGNVLPDPNLGTSAVSFASNMGGKGIQFDSCAIQQALAPTNYKILSFREISQ